MCGPAGARAAPCRVVAGPGASAGCDGGGPAPVERAWRVCDRRRGEATSARRSETGERSAMRTTRFELLGREFRGGVSRGPRGREWCVGRRPAGGCSRGPRLFRGRTRLRGYSFEVTGEAASCLYGRTRPGGGLPGAACGGGLGLGDGCPHGSGRLLGSSLRLAADGRANRGRAASGGRWRRRQAILQTLSFPLAQAFGVLPVVGATGQFRTCPGQSVRVRNRTMGANAGSRRVSSDGGARESRGQPGAG